MMSHTKFFMHSSSGYLGIVIKQKAKYRFCVITLFYILKKYYQNRCICYYTVFHGPVLSVASVTHAGSVCGCHVGITDGRKLRSTTVV
jgi:hypothetical protein